MRTRVAVVCTAMLTGAMLAVPAAWADDLDDDLDIEPERVRPGETITVSGGCRDNDTFVNVWGAARGRGAVSTGHFSIRAKVRKERPGRYSITSKCIPSGYPQTGRVQVVRHTWRDRDEPDDWDEPDGWVKTGGGGTQGPGFPWTGLGLALVAGAAGIGGVAMLRTRARGRE